MLAAPEGRNANGNLMSPTRAKNRHSMIGERIGSFRIESWLGAGSMSVVYRGAHASSGRPAAIKVAREAAAGGQGRFRDAADFLLRLHHPNIARALAIGRHREIPYLALEYVRGFTLAQVLAQHRPIPWIDVVAIGRELCAALAFIHDLGVIHRNLKPSHVILSSEGQVKLVGFGLVRSMDASFLADEGRTRGTPGFMAPEQLDSRPMISPSSDLYALGVVLWHLLTGEEPYQELWNSDRPRTRASLVAAHLTEPAPRPSGRTPGIPEPLDDLVVRLMAKAPHARPRDALEVASLLEKLQPEAQGPAGKKQTSGRGVDLPRRPMAWLHNLSERWPDPSAWRSSTGITW
jgi:serine/threonine-protein kinase